MTSKILIRVILSQKADVEKINIETDVTEQVKLILSDNPDNKAYKIDENGKETQISFDDARALFAAGKAKIKDIALDKIDSSPKIYTSRFQNPELKSGNYTVVGIVRGLPRFRLGYERAGNIIDIAPPREIFYINDSKVFNELYVKHLEKVGIKKILTELEHYLAFGKDLVLCCYEDVRDPNQSCHRIAFAKWWFENTGQIIPELPNPAPIKFK